VQFGTIVEIATLLLAAMGWLACRSFRKHPGESGGAGVLFERLVKFLTRIFHAEQARGEACLTRY
jgi:hypothetical protein